PSPSNSVGADSLKAFVKLLLGVSSSPDAPPCPNWPPDLFAVVAYVLFQTGEYRRITQPSLSEEPHVGTRDQWCEARRTGHAWRAKLDEHIGRHGEHQDHRNLNDALQDFPILEWWTELMSHADRPMSALGSMPVDINLLFRLFFAADEACLGIGMADPVKRGDKPSSDPPARGFHDQAVRFMQQFNGNRSLCIYV